MAKKQLPKKQTFRKIMTTIVTDKGKHTRIVEIDKDTTKDEAVEFTHSWLKQLAEEL